MTVKVNKEVILSGGAVGSPHVLLHSGVGPKDVLTGAGVPVQIELPGVGQHLQDHIVRGCLFYCLMCGMLIDVVGCRVLRFRSRLMLLPLLRFTLVAVS